MNNPQILIIDDEQQIRKLLSIILESNHYTVKTATTGKDGIMMAAHSAPDLIILDLGLPDQSGHEVLRELRTWYQKGIIILSVLDAEEEIIRALDHGASDYLTKPFRTGELLARIRACIRHNVQTQDQSALTIGDLQIDLVSRIVRKENEIIRLTPTEFNLLVLLATHEGRVLTHHFILKEIWGVAYQQETQYLRVFIGQLRKKIESDPNQPKHIITESRIGYRFS